MDIASGANLQHFASKPFFFLVHEKRALLTHLQRLDLTPTKVNLRHLEIGGKTIAAHHCSPEGTALSGRWGWLFGSCA
jgi:hypothetical protein